MKTLFCKPSTSSDRKLSQFAHGLLYYLNQTKNDAFTSAMAQAILIDLVNLPTSTTPEIQQADRLSTSTHRWFAPSEHDQASRLYHWLSEAIIDTPYQYPYTRQHLLTWAQERIAPQDVVLGIVGIAIIGPTLGLIKSKKKKKSQLRIILPTATYTKTPKAELAALTHLISGRTVATELRHARGRLNKLHPDTADWLTSDHLITLYTATPAVHNVVTTTLVDNQLPHSTHALAPKLVVLGISPSVSDTFLGDFDVTPVTALDQT